MNMHHQSILSFSIDLSTCLSSSPFVISSLSSLPYCRLIHSPRYACCFISPHACKFHRVEGPTAVRNPPPSPVVKRDGRPKHALTRQVDTSNRLKAWSHTWLVRTYLRTILVHRVVVVLATDLASSQRWLAERIDVASILENFTPCSGRRAWARGKAVWMIVWL